MGKLLLKPVEAAEVLGIGRTKLFELLASGALESVQIGHCRRVPLDAVEGFLTKLRAEQDNAKAHQLEVV
jgi:excisionase family DNA binding protein